MRAYGLVVAVLAAAVALGSAPGGAVEPRPGGQPDLSVEAIAKRTLPALVTVVVKNGQGQPVRSGSGFFVAAGRVATNLHVVSGGGAVSIVTADRRELPAISAQVDERHDLAVLDCPAASTIAPLALANADQLAIGETVVAAGSPLGMSGTISTGVVSAKREVGGATVIQTTAPISQGSSGGPLIDKRGRVVGVTSFMAADGQNLNFAQLSVHVATLLRAGGKVVDLRRGEGIVAKPNRPDPNQSALLALLAQPMFSGSEFKQRLIGAAALELFDVARQRVYFSLARGEGSDESDRKRVDAVAGRFVADSSRVVLAEAEGLRARFPDYAFQRSAAKWLFFATEVANLRLGTGGPMTFRYKEVEYSITSGELRSFLDNASVRGGAAAVDASAYGIKLVLNSGALVARPDEPSLFRLARDLTKGLRDTEAKIQRLADFVATEIETDRALGATVRLRAAEVLLARRGSPTHKAVLLASLLEQVAAEYALVYSKSDVWVAVPQGGFKNDNRLGFSFENKPWTLVDLSAPGFVIGATPAPAQPVLEELRFVQFPQQDQRLYHRPDGKPVGAI